MSQNLTTCRYLLKLSYIGTQYKGLQRLTRRLDNEQEEDGTIQCALERAMNRALLPVYGSRLALSSRTDAGVHALVNYANVDLTHPLGETIYQPSFITDSVNYILHKNNQYITLLETRIVPSYFHSRTNAKSRSYIYRLAVPKLPPPTVGVRNNMSLHALLPVSQFQRCHIINNNVNMGRLEECMSLFLGEHDFGAFSTSGDDNRPTVRTLDRFELYKPASFDGLNYGWDDHNSKLDYYEIFVKAKSFLYNQIRRMVAAVIDVGLGHMDFEDVSRLLQEGRHTYRPPHISPMVPPYGLYLADVEYDHDDFILYENFNEYSPKAESSIHDLEL